MNIDVRKNLELGGDAYRALMAWRKYLHEVMDVTDKVDAKVLGHVNGALVDIEDALKIPVDASKRS
jgi:hypothetical protein